MHIHRYWNNDRNSPLEPSGAAVNDRNWLPWTVYAFGITAFTILDVYLALGQWRALFFFAMAILGTLALRGTLPAWVIGSISLLGTVVIIATDDPARFATSFGIGESFIMIILVVTMFGGPLG